MDKHDRDEVFKWTMTKLRMAVDGVVAPPPIDLNLGNVVEEAKKEENNPSNDDYKITETADVDLGLKAEASEEEKEKLREKQFKEDLDAAKLAPETTLVFELSPEEQADMTDNLRARMIENDNSSESESSIEGLKMEIPTDEAGLREFFGDLDLEGDEETGDSIEDVAKSQDENCK
jgi:hypothetical protein